MTVLGHNGLMQIAESAQLEEVDGFHPSLSPTGYDNIHDPVVAPFHGPHSDGKEMPVKVRSRGGTVYDAKWDGKASYFGTRRVAEVRFDDDGTTAIVDIDQIASDRPCDANTSRGIKRSREKAALTKCGLGFGSGALGVSKRPLPPRESPF